MDCPVLAHALDRVAGGWCHVHQLQLGSIGACLIKYLQGVALQTAGSNSSCSRSSQAPTADLSLKQQLGGPLQDICEVQAYPPQRQLQQMWLMQDQPMLQSPCSSQRQQQQSWALIGQSDLAHPRPMFCHRSSLQFTEQRQLQACNPAHRWQQTQAYHPATHRARLLTSKLLQQTQWQDLQLLYDMNGGRARLNAIHLATVLQQLVRLAPAPELAPSAERQRLQVFTAELIAAGHAKLHQYDHRALASLTQSLVKLGCYVNNHHATPHHAASTGDRSNTTSSSPVNDTMVQAGSLFEDLITATIKQLPHATSQSCSSLCSAFTNLLKQLQQGSDQRLEWQQKEKHLLLLQQLVSCMVARLRTLAATGQLSICDASKAVLAACRLAATIEAAAPPSTQCTTANAVTRELQPLLLLAAEQAAKAAEDMTFVLPVSESSQLLYTLATTRASASSDCVLGLLKQYSLALHDLAFTGSTVASVSKAGSRQYRVAPAASPYHAEAADDSNLEAAVRSLPATLWAIGRLLELQRSHRQQSASAQQQYATQLQHCTKLWQELGACIAASTAQLANFSPVQLAKLANGLAKLVCVSRAHVAAAEHSSNYPTGPASSAGHVSQQGESDIARSDELLVAAKTLSNQLSGAGLRRLLQQHLTRVEGLLPLMPVAQRKQLAGAYKQLGVQLPWPVAIVFERDAAVADK